MRASGAKKEARLFRSSRIVTPQGIQDGAVYVQNGTVRTILPAGVLPPNIPIEELGSLVLLPGLVDTHVHINEPGRADWEGFETATRAAAAGGITTLFDMPLNSLPVTTTVEALEAKRAAAEGKCHVDCGFLGGLIPGNAGQIEPLLNAGVPGIKAFLVHSGIEEFPNAGEPDLRAVLPLLARHGVPLLVHAELAGDAPAASSLRRYADYLASRPPEWECKAIGLMIRLCAEFQCPVHIVHLSAAEALPALRSARAAGLPLTVETCPHYLRFRAESIRDGDTLFKCAPPIRESANRERLWEALREGLIDLVVSDHSPCPPALKRRDAGDFASAWGGIAALQLGLSAVWTEAGQRGFGPADIARWMSERPAALMGFQDRKGAITPGADADFCAFDPEAEWVVHGAELQHRHGITPYEGQRLRGTVRATYLRGRPIYRDGAFAETPLGDLLGGRRASR